MPYVTTKEMLIEASKKHYAIGAFNVENLEMMKAVIEAAQESNAPVILQTTPSTLKYIQPEEFFANVKTIAEKVHIPVALHLDHGNSFDLAIRAFHAGYSSIMIDASKESLSKNIEITKSVKDVCVCGMIPVEAELGKVGGKEDDYDGVNSALTDPQNAVTFLEKSHVDSLAVAIGTAHGFYKGIPELDIERLKAIESMVNIPLVLHGASGVPDKAVKEAIQYGICKVNYATELRVAYTNAIREALSSDGAIIDPKIYGKSAMQAIKELVKHKIQVCGSMNQIQ